MISPQYKSTEITNQDPPFQPSYRVHLVGNPKKTVGQFQSRDDADLFAAALNQPATQAVSSVPSVPTYGSPVQTPNTNYQATNVIDSMIKLVRDNPGKFPDLESILNRNGM